MAERRHLTLPAILLSIWSLLATGCSGRHGGAPQRLAVVAFENLSSNAELDWMRRALATVVVRDLAGAPAIHAETVESVNSAYAIEASRVLEGYFYEANGRLEIRAAVEDLASKKTIANLAVGGAVANGAVSSANELARQLSAAARVLRATNEAFQEFGESLSAGDRSMALSKLGAATRDDPHFSLAFRDLARVLLSGGDRSGALKAIEAGERGQPDAIERAEFEYMAATIRDDVNARVSALESLTRLTPSDSRLFRELAQLELAERQLSEAARNYEAATRLNPQDASLWNELGYVLALDQDLTGARRALEHHQALLGDENVNGLDSLGEVSFYLGDFGGAARYFLQADQKNRNEFGGADLFKAAQARMLAGDLRAGDSLMQQYAGLFPGGQKGRAAFQLAQWEFITGRRKSAMAGLERIIPAVEGDAQSLELSQLSIWKLQTGETKAAADLASEAAAKAVSPQARNLSAICRIISMPPAGRPSGSRMADAYAVLFARKFSEALPLLETLYRATSPLADGQVRTLLAWAYVETNRSGDAGRMIGTYPVPFSSGESVFASLVFPRYLFVRGVVMEKSGKRAEARRAYELFLKYSGDVPDAFGDEAAARRSLGTL